MRLRWLGFCILVPTILLAVYLRFGRRIVDRFSVGNDQSAWQLAEGPVTDVEEQPASGAQRMIVEEVQGDGVLRVTYVKVGDQWVRESAERDLQLLREQLKDWLSKVNAITCVGAALSMVSSIAILFIAFSVSIWWGLGCLVVPGLSLIFVITHWRETSLWFILALLGWVLTLVGMALAQ